MGASVCGCWSCCRRRPLCENSQEEQEREKEKRDRKISFFFFFFSFFSFLLSGFTRLLHGSRGPAAPTSQTGHPKTRTFHTFCHHRVTRNPGAAARAPRVPRGPMSIIPGPRAGGPRILRTPGGCLSKFLTISYYLFSLVITSLE